MATEDYEDLEENLEEDEIDRGDDIEDEDLDENEEDLDENEEDLDEDTSDDEDEQDEQDDEEVEIQIPKSRLDEVIAQRESEKERSRWLEDQLETLINQTPTAPDVKAEPKEAYNFTGAEESYANLLIEGDIAKAASLRSTIDSERKKEMVEMINEIKESSSKEAASTSSAAIEDDRFSTMISNFENKHKFLDADSDNYNEEAVETVNTLLAGYQAAGKSKSQALKLAVGKVIPMFEETSTEKATLGKTKTKAARRKAAKASNAQPPKTSSKGVKNRDTDSVDVSKLSERDFDKLTLKERRVLRGD